MTEKTTSQKMIMYEDLASEMREKEKRTNSAADFEFAAYNEKLKLSSEADIIYYIEKYRKCQAIKDILKWRHKNGNIS